MFVKSSLKEASLLDRIKMTENRLEFDRKKFDNKEPKHWNMTKNSLLRKLTFEIDQNMDEFE